MKANIIIDAEGIIRNVISYPLKDDLPIVEVESLSDIHIGYDKYLDGEIVEAKDYSASIDKVAIELEIAGLKKKLAETDYMCLKHMDGALTDEEYEGTKTLRQSYRDEINALEEKLK